ncbi:hypothetical protein LJB99_05660 [Deltaproteobacteria bacterium OttesenSCG-928-K17]|nr:hypothetical protein [Deltaproteobacteria bacterium OttesenSCG-928-K17]
MSKLKSERDYRPLARKIGLWLLGLMVAVTLTGADAVRPDYMSIRNSDHLLYVKLVASTVTALEKGQLPVRVGESLSQDVGNPYHQFYSPAATLIPAVFVILTGNLFQGISLMLVFMTALAFVWAYHLCRYLSINSMWALVGAFLYVCAPHLSIDRVLKAAMAEYLALCLAPMVIYLQCRYLANLKAANWAAASLAWALLLHTHFITTAYLVFFAIVFWGLHGLMLLVPGSSPQRRKLAARKYLKRTGAWFAVGFTFLALSAWYFIPIVASGDLIIKSPRYLAATKTFDYMTTVLPFFSLRDMPWPQAAGNVILSFQAGLLLTAGFAAFIYYNRPRQAAARTLSGEPFLFAWPLWLTGLFILAAVIFPGLIFTGPLKMIDIAQLSSRFTGHFVIPGVLMAVFALKAFALSQPDLGAGGRKVLALMVISLSLVLVSPYLAPLGYPEGYPKGSIAAQFTFLKEPFEYDEAYGRGQKDGDQYAPMPQSVILVAPAHMRNNADRTFSVDLREKAALPQWDGGLVLNVQHYPGLQELEITLDGRDFKPDIETFWAYRADLGPRLPFHGLALRNLPGEGALKVRVRFVGSRAGNYISLAALIVVAGVWAVQGRRRAMRRRKPAAA